MKFLISQKGVAIYLALIIMFILLGIGLGLTAILIGQIKMIRGIGYSVPAFYAADSGAERALYGVLINNDKSTIPETFLDNGSSYEVSLCHGKIKSNGKYQYVKRAIETTYPFVGLYIGLSPPIVYIYEKGSECEYEFLYTFPFAGISPLKAFGIYENDLYAGGSGASGQRLYVSYDGFNWEQFYDIPQNAVMAFGSYNGKFYIGTDDDIVWEYDGPSESWNSYNLVTELGVVVGVINNLVVYNDGSGNKLYASFNDRVAVFDGINWGLTSDIAPGVFYPSPLAVYNGRLYAGDSLTTTNVAVYVYDGTIWQESVTMTEITGIISSFAVYNDGTGEKLYATIYDATPANDDSLYSYDETSLWTLVWNPGPNKNLAALAVYEDKLYIGLEDLYVYDGTGDPQLVETSSDIIIHLITHSP